MGPLRFNYKNTFRYERPPQIFDFVAFMGASPHFRGARLPLAPT